MGCIKILLGWVVLSLGFHLCLREHTALQTVLHAVALAMQ
jgi:hypothetical protein